MEAQAIEQGSELHQILLELRKMNNMQNQIWDIEHIGDYLNLSTQSVYKLIKDKTFPCCIVLPTGGKRWKADAVKEWIDRRPQSKR